MPDPRFFEDLGPVLQIRNTAQTLVFIAQD